MTDRRSLQTNDARVSRAFQFVPGHVGGRVASAQPVRFRRHVGGIAAQVGTPPTTIDVNFTKNGGTQTIAAPVAMPTDLTHGIVLLAAMNCDGFTPPTGWTELAGGGPYGVGDVSGGVIAQWSIMHTTDPTATRTFTVPNYNPLSGSRQFLSVNSAWFTGGSTAGTWSVTEGTHQSNQSRAYATAVPDDAAAWVQLVAGTGVYTWVDSGGFDYYANGQLVPICHPATDGTKTITGETPVAGGTLIDWNNIGAYGKPNSLTFAAVWTP